MVPFIKGDRLLVISLTSDCDLRKFLGLHVEEHCRVIWANIMAMIRSDGAQVIWFVFAFGLCHSEALNVMNEPFQILMGMSQNQLSALQ